MATDPALIIAVFGALGTLGTAIYVNRRNIHRLMAWAWGEERDETDAGAAGQTMSLAERLDDLGEKIDEDTEARKRDHQRVEVEIKRNRRLVFDSLGNLVEAMNAEVPEAELDPDDIEPDWYGVVREEDDRMLRDGGPGRTSQSDD